LFVGQAVWVFNGLSDTIGLSRRKRNGLRRYSTQQNVVRFNGVYTNMQYKKWKYNCKMFSKSIT